MAPTPITTHMVNAIGLRHMRRYALMGDQFGAAEAERSGLLHEVVPAAALETRLASVPDAVFLSGPDAIAMTKQSFLGANGLLLDECRMTSLPHGGWTQRASPEGLEGRSAFQEKRVPACYRPSG